MIETHINPTMIDAQRRAHIERAAAFATLFRSVPRALSGLRRLR